MVFKKIFFITILCTALPVATAFAKTDVSTAIKNQITQNNSAVGIKTYETSINEAMKYMEVAKVDPNYQAENQTPPPIIEKPTIEEPLVEEPPPMVEPEKSENALTPHGNFTLVDDVTKEISEDATQEFLTVVTKNGNYLYLVIDKNGGETENVHLLNMVDETDLLSLITGEPVAFEPPVDEVPPVIAPPVVETIEPTTTSSNKVNSFMLFLIIGLLLAGVYVYFKFIKDNDDYDIDDVLEQDIEDDDETLDFDEFEKKVSQNDATKETSIENIGDDEVEDYV